MLIIGAGRLDHWQGTRLANPVYIIELHSEEVHRMIKLGLASAQETSAACLSDPQGLNPIILLYIQSPLAFGGAGPGTKLSHTGLEHLQVQALGSQTLLTPLVSRPQVLL